MNWTEEQRLEDALDRDWTIEYDGNTSTYHPAWHWGTGDFDSEYPVVTVTYQGEADQRDDEQPVNDLLEVDEKEGSPDYDFHEVSRVRDELQMQVATNVGIDDNGVPRHHAVEQMAMGLWKAVRFELDFNETGPNGERPMVFSTVTSPSGPVSMEGTLRETFAIAADYLIINTRTVDSVDEAETDTSVN